MWTQTEVDTQSQNQRATRGEPNNWLTVTPFGESVSNWPGSYRQPPDTTLVARRQNLNECQLLRHIKVNC